MQLSRTALRPWGAGLAAALVTAALVAVAPSAAAAPTLTFTAAAPDADPVIAPATTIEVPLGETVELAWAASAEADSVTATDTDTDAWGATDGAGPGPKATQGSEDFNPTAIGTYAFPLTAVEDADSDNPVSVTVTVEVVEPGDETDIVTPEPVTQDGCTFTVPDTEGVDYLVDFEGDLIPFPAGTYPTVAFEEEESVLFTAEPQAGFAFPEGVETEFTVEISDDCAGSSAELVTATPTCEAVTFANISDAPVAVLYGSTDEDEEDPDGAVELNPGESAKVSTPHSSLAFLASDPEFIDFVLSEDEDADIDFEDIPLFQFGEITVPQNCSDEAGAGAEFPTTAPAAGI